ncbi:hypothetical protein DYB32_006660 [Aphanomyces invadans]|uniref:Uncharacterized protein n=1 Tax=Aphanomyces invadans TaxID=157072 RepID=A0A3R6VUQ0_9STRA|nr:hypothetical protein DYB32_006660 [Aphanomyces invadans]
MIRFKWLLCASIAFILVDGQSTETPKSCCATCLDTITKFHYDPTKWSECVKETACCFCSSPDPGSPTFDPVPPLVRNVPQLKQGEMLQFAWPGVLNVTYVFQQGNKTALPKLKDPFMKHDGDIFSACFDSVGTLYFRGWSKDPCMSASSEKVVRIVASNNPEASCSSTTTPAPTKRGACNLQRAALRANGDCVCSWLEFSNPPDCTDPSIYKIGAIATSATAGLVAVLSALFKCWKKQRRRKQTDVGAARAEKVESSGDVSVTTSSYAVDRANYTSHHRTLAPT